jgi:acetolactate synthase-1/2/3 large subunit
MATRGVGASNLAIGVHTARQDSTPMLVLLGQVETDFLGREAFQEVDLAAFYAPITKWSATVHRADRLAEMVARALRIATSGRPGPVMLALPADVLGEMVPDDPRAGVTAPPRSGPAPGEAREIARRIAAARSPRDHSRAGARGAREELVSFARLSTAASTQRGAGRTSSRTRTRTTLGHLALGAQSGDPEGAGRC